MTPFDLDDALQPRPGAGSVRFLAMLLTLSVRDGADHLFVEPGRGEDGSELTRLQYRVAGVLYDLVPAPRSVLPKLARVIRRRVAGVTSGDGGHAGWMVVTLGGRRFTTWVMLVADGPHDRITVTLPPVPGIREAAGEALRTSMGSGGLVEFNDDFDAPDFDLR